MAVSTTGSSTGGDLTFTTDVAPATPPLAVTGSADSIGVHSAVLSGTANANGIPTSVCFEYGTTTAYETGTLSQPLGSGSDDLSVSGTITGLIPNTDYHFRVVALSVSGTSPGSDATFTTAPLPVILPTVVSGAATGVGFSTATLNGTIDPNEFGTSAHFEFGTTTGYGSQTSAQPMGSGSVAVPTSASLSGLSLATVYHYRLVAVSTSGTSPGDDRSFVTSGGVPAVGGIAISRVGARLVTASATVNPNGFSTKASFQYGRTTAYGSTTAVTTVAAAVTPSTVTVT